MRAYSQKAPDAPSHCVSVRKVWATSALVTQLTVAAAPPATPLTCNNIKQISLKFWLCQAWMRQIPALNCRRGPLAGITREGGIPACYRAHGVQPWPLTWATSKQACTLLSTTKALAMRAPEHLPMTCLLTAQL